MLVIGRLSCGKPRRSSGLPSGRRVLWPLNFSFPRANMAGARRHVAHEVQAGHLVSADEGELGHAAVALDGFQEGLVERQHLFLLRRGLLPVVSPLAKDIHHGGRVEFFRAALSASQAAGAAPEGRAPEDLLFGRRISDLNQAHDLVGHQVHVPGHGAAGGALAALVASGNVHVRGLADELRQIRRLCNLHGILSQRPAFH